MQNPAYDLPEKFPQETDMTPEPKKVKVTLLDGDDLPMARGSATLPLSPGGGVFWPDCPMPPEERLSGAKCFLLPEGGVLPVKNLTLCCGCPPHYDFLAAIA